MTDPDGIDYTIEWPDIYDGMSATVYNDGRIVNRWANDEGTGPKPGYERRYRLTEEAIKRWKELDSDQRNGEA
jgi:hypothetical protein